MFFGEFSPQGHKGSRQMFDGKGRISILLSSLAN
jgi:hypothetical protein